MAGRGRTTFQKKQKEQARAERRQAKAARKQARKAAKAAGIEEPEESLEPETDLDVEIEGESEEPGSDAGTAEK